MRGFKPIPIPRGSKNPGKGWNRLSVTEAEVDGLFAPDGNIGIRLGAPSGGLVDVDLDCDEAVLLRGFLEPTDLRHGRPGRLSSHHFYLCDDAGRRVCFKDPVSRKMICELRGDGLQTLVPPSIHPEDEQLAWEAFGDPARGSWDALLEQLGVVAAGALLVRYYPAEGSRHHFVMALEGTLLRAGMEEEKLERFIEEVAKAAGDEEYRARVRDVASTAAALEEGRPATGHPTLADYLSEPVIEQVLEWLGLDVKRYEQRESRVLKPHPFTDAGNAYRLIEKHGHNLRYVSAWKTWLRWTKKQWRKSERPMDEALHTVLSLRAQFEADPASEDLLQKHCRRSQNQGPLIRMTGLAAEDRRVMIEPSDLDQDRHLLNVLNGTIDLQTGELRRHRREDLITKLAPSRYEPDASLPILDDFLGETFGGDLELVEFMQTVAGLCLTGETRSDVLFFAYGPTASGKSTFAEGLLAAMGPYGRPVNPDHLSQGSTEGSDHIAADLAGVRFAVGSESERSNGLRVALLKRFAGGDALTARQRYGRQFQYSSQFKLFLPTNHLPDLPRDDRALRRRIVLLPFSHSVPTHRRDPNVRRLLSDSSVAGAAWLAWAVKGAVRYYERGLSDFPEAVRRLELELWADATDRTINHNVRFVPGNQEKQSAVHKKCREWAYSNGLGALTPQKLKKRLLERGVREKKSGERFYVGVRLVDV
jgi:putative DNA primase/helicase